MFCKGDVVMYGSVGVCTVMSVGVPDVPGVTYECYTLQPRFTESSKIYAPVNSTAVKIRAPLSATQAETLIDALPGLEGFSASKDKQEAYKTYREALRSADSMQLAKLIKTLHVKKLRAAEQRKTMASGEKELYDMAEKILHGELATALHMPMEKMEGYISSRLGIEEETPPA